MMEVRTLVNYLVRVGRWLSPCARALAARLGGMAIIGCIPWLKHRLLSPEGATGTASAHPGREPDPAPFAELRELKATSAWR